MPILPKTNMRLLIPLIILSLIIISCSQSNSVQQTRLRFQDTDIYCDVETGWIIDADGIGHPPHRVLHTIYQRINDLHSNYSLIISVAPGYDYSIAYYHAGVWDFLYELQKFVYEC